MTLVRDAGDEEARAIAALVQAGRDEEARIRAIAALKSGHDGDAILAFAAMLAAKAGDPADAVIHLEALLARRPGDGATRLNLAGALIALERFDRIAPLLEGVPQAPPVDRLAAFAALRTGDHDRARTLYRRVLAVWRDDADSWANLAAAELAQGQLSAAVAALEEAITARRGEPRFYLALADVLERADRSADRLKVMRDAAAITPEDPAISLALGLAAAAADDVGAAEEAFRRTIASAPADAAAYLELGLLLETQNRLPALDRLIADAQGLLGAELALLEAWAAFRAGRVEQADAIARTIPDTVSDLRRYQLRAQIADRRGDADEAFDLFGRMNVAALALSPPVAGPGYRDAVVADAAAFRLASPAARPATDLDDGVPTPVFVMGFPRSGTTLIDTLLGRLPDTHVLEEQPLIPTIQRDIGSVVTAMALDHAAIAHYRQRYAAMLERQAPGSSAMRVIDKHPLHMARMPLIDRLFPGAPVLLVERHPYDVVLSCFMASFRLNQAMRSFTDLEEAARTYDAVFTAWHEAEERLDLNVRRVRYERLVAAPEEEMRAATDHLGARYDPGIIDNVAGARARGRIRTASYSQVTEPIYQRAVARWHRYRTHLAPVLPILAPWAERMGYDL